MAGRQETLLKRERWSCLNKISKTSNNFNFKIMKKILLVLLILVSFTFNVHPSPGWFSQNSGTSEKLNDVFFINNLTGWAVGDTGIIVKTTNGGINWFQQYNPNDKELLAVRFINESTGWAVGGQFYYNPMNCDYMVIIKTTNGGTNWYVQLFSGSGHIFYDLCVINSNTVYATNLGSNFGGLVTEGYINTTTNGGINWYSIPNLEFGFGYKSIFFLNQNTGWAMGFYASCTPPMYCRVLKTTNSGMNWSIINQDSSDFGFGHFGKIRFLDHLNGYLLSRGLKKTTDGGHNWETTDSIVTPSARGYYFANKDTGWIVGHNSINRTDNGGTNWSSQNAPATATLYSVYFLNKNTGWAVGSNGTILKTTTGGITSVKQISTFVPKKSELLQNYPNPFNPVTTITYNIRSSGEIVLKVYDIKGREITTLVNENQTPGTYEVVFDATSLPSGVYFYKLKAMPDGRQAGEFVETRKMVVVK